ncbi:hypothetical protein CWI38_0286p0030 [Hamiltosporidium tvaerminnensis]|uniref:Uncharacterized protein n=2 Tax=Hamiltosporidium TaxID=1176354 RepID=A0A4Q9KUE5_9MICR|nr:hypothetical protein CWI37_2025p0010 [Hamiltosporidium tvaerminnensis]TBU00165.1 hypothetical protein CWI36_1725p0010 [Hamiltosporidium magnivora]TBU17600.1 hypothetical protein CWI38_0286p0030 [Hamiltosporidium tvaerminnensis]
MKHIFIAVRIIDNIFEEKLHLRKSLLPIFYIIFDISRIILKLVRPALIQEDGCHIFDRNKRRWNIITVIYRIIGIKRKDPFMTLEIFRKIGDIRSNGNDLTKKIFVSIKNIQLIFRSLLLFVFIISRMFFDFNLIFILIKYLYLINIDYRLIFIEILLMEIIIFSSRIELKLIISVISFVRKCDDILIFSNTLFRNTNVLLRILFKAQTLAYQKTALENITFYDITFFILKIIKKKIDIIIFLNKILKTVLEIINDINTNLMHLEQFLKSSYKLNY